MRLPTFVIPLRVCPSIFRVGNHGARDGFNANQETTYDILPHFWLAYEHAEMTRLLSSFGEMRISVGLGNTVLYATARLLDKVTRGRCRLIKYYFVAQPVPPLAAQVRAKSSNTRIYVASQGDGIIRQFPRPSAVIAKRFADGAHCLVAEQAGTLVGFLWLKEGSYCEDEVRCRYLLHPPEELVWDFDTYVAPKFRMSRAFAQLWEAANTFLRERRYRWTISRISAFNAASLASHGRLGIVRLHTGIFLLAGPVQLSAFSDYPFFHLGLGPDSVPTRDFRAPAQHPTK